jgi:hypothetical protein
MSKLEKLNSQHLSDMAFIEEMRDSPNPEMRAITKFLLETDANPYNFLPADFADGFNSSSGFAYLLIKVHHGLCDDGEISFPIISGNPKIRFSDYQSNSTEFCDDVFDFITKYTDLHQWNIKRDFIHDAARHGFKFAINHYSHSDVFDPNWESDSAVQADVNTIRSALGIDNIN